MSSIDFKDEKLSSQEQLTQKTSIVWNVIDESSSSILNVLKGPVTPFSVIKELYRVVLKKQLLQQQESSKINQWSDDTNKPLFDWFDLSNLSLVDEPLPEQNKWTMISQRNFSKKVFWDDIRLKEWLFWENDECALEKYSRVIKKITVFWWLEDDTFDHYIEHDISLQDIPREWFDPKAMEEIMYLHILHKIIYWVHNTEELKTKNDDRKFHDWSL